MNFSFTNVLLVGAGGFIGAGSRYMLAHIATQYFKHSSFPYGTLIVNLTGCLLIGIIAALFRKFDIGQEQIRLLIMVGILGGFTTFSTFAHESFLLWESGKAVPAMLSLGLQVTAGLFLVWFGYALVRWF